MILAAAGHFCDKGSSGGSAPGVGASLFGANHGDYIRALSFLGLRENR